jgi:hypothetical protein
MAAKKSSGTIIKLEHVSVSKKTSIGGRKSSISSSMMNKSTKRSHKAYRGQGR